MSLTQKQRAAKLQRYRTEQSRIAIERDNYTCRRCGAAGCEVHHVHGRAATWDVTDRRRHEDRERADRQITLCNACHSRCHWALPPISKNEIEDILERVLEEET